jgi:predicted transcriptional regulator
MFPFQKFRHFGTSALRHRFSRRKHHSNARTRMSAGGTAMHEKTIKIDDRTDELVTQLAYFMRGSKKSIVREAVADFAESRRHRMGTGDAGGTGDAVGGSNASAADLGTAGGLDGRTFDDLDPYERLALRRTELIREFARHGGTNIRVFERDPKYASGQAPAQDAAYEEVLLLADTDLDAGGGAVPVLEEVARRVLRARVTVLSLTALRLFDPARLERGLAGSEPL